MKDISSLKAIKADQNLRHQYERLGLTVPTCQMVPTEEAVGLSTDAWQVLLTL